MYKLLEKNVIRFKGDLTSSTRSRKMVGSENYFSLNDKLAILALNFEFRNDKNFNSMKLESWKCRQKELISFHAQRE